MKSISKRAQLSLTFIISNGLVFFTALIIRDFMMANIEFLSNSIPIENPNIKRLINVVLILSVVAAVLVGIDYWKDNVEAATDVDHSAVQGGEGQRAEEDAERQVNPAAPASFT